MPETDPLKERMDKQDVHVEAKFRELWDAIDRLRDKMDRVIINRLPVWATLLIGILTAACGFSVSTATRCMMFH